MAEPKIAAKSKIVLTLEPGEYWWCRCGHSQNQPFCDGLHKTVEGGFSPVKFEITETQRVGLCRCKHTKDQPWCDDTHLELRDKES